MIRVLVADDSAFSRVTLSRMIEKDPDMKVIATAINGEEAIRLVIALQPDIMTLDLEMPGMDGFAVLRWLSINRPTPAIVVSSRNGQEDVFRALDLGAVDFVVKPQAHASPEYTRLETVLLDKIRAVSHSRPARPIPVGKPPARRAPVGSGRGIVVIGTSTGGPAALTTLFSSLPKLAGPILVAQHMPAGFTGPFADRLSRIALFPVTEARDGEPLQGGRAYVAPGGSHLEVAGDPDSLHCRVLPRAPEDLYSPSVDRLFVSAANVVGPRAVAVVLTGMGSDGREGVRAIRNAGGRTLAESEESAVVFGMPREAAATGAVDEVRPLAEIPDAIVRLLCDIDPVSVSA
jgi:two-component system chemotaxis response regulator CheB